MEQITFKEMGTQTHFSCGCKTDVIGENFLIDPCSLQCEVYLYCIEQSKNQGNVISYHMTNSVPGDVLVEPHEKEMSPNTNKADSK